MKTARGALRELPTHLLKELAERCLLTHESVPVQSNGLTSVPSRQAASKENRHKELSFLSRFGRWLRRLFLGAETCQQVGPAHTSSSSGEALPREQAARSQIGNDAAVEPIKGKQLNGYAVPAPSEQPFLSPTNNRELDRLVRRILGEKVFGKITLQLVTDELARRGEPYCHPFDKDGTLTIKDSDLTDKESDGHLSLRPGVERLIKTANYKKISVETSDPVSITEPVRGPEIEISSRVPLSVTELHASKVTVPALAVKTRLTAATFEGETLRCRLLKAGTVKATKVDVECDVRVSHLEVLEHLTVGGRLDGVSHDDALSHISVGGKASIGAFGSSISPNAFVAGTSLIEEIQRKADLSSLNGRRTFGTLVKRAREARNAPRKGRSESFRDGDLKGESVEKATIPGGVVI
jgi:hypothetical protein